MDLQGQAENGNMYVHFTYILCLCQWLSGCFSPNFYAEILTLSWQCYKVRAPGGDWVIREQSLRMEWCSYEWALRMASHPLPLKDKSGTARRGFLLWIRKWMVMWCWNCLSWASQTLKQWEFLLCHLSHAMLVQQPAHSYTCKKQTLPHAVPILPFWDGFFLWPLPPTSLVDFVLLILKLTGAHFLHK